MNAFLKRRLLVNWTETLDWTAAHGTPGSHRRQTVDAEGNASHRLAAAATSTAGRYSFGLAVGLASLGLVSLGASVRADDTLPNSDSASEPTHAMQSTALPSLRTELQAIARPKREALLRFPTIGQVSRVHVAEGAVVPKGTPLLTLDDSVQSAQVTAARVAAESKAGVSQAEIAAQRAARALERIKHAQTLAASSNFEVEARQSEYDQALAMLEQQKELQRTHQAELQLAIANQAQLTLAAPFDGQVVLIGVKAGNTVDNSTVAVQIADLSLLEVELHLPSTLYGQLHVGETRTLVAGVPVNQSIQATIRYVSPVVEPTGGTFLVRAEIDNADGRLPAGFEVWLPQPQ